MRLYIRTGQSCGKCLGQFVLLLPRCTYSPPHIYNQSVFMERKKKHGRLHLKILSRNRARGLSCVGTHPRPAVGDHENSDSGWFTPTPIWLIKRELSFFVAVTLVTRANRDMILAVVRRLWQLLESNTWMMPWYLLLSCLDPLVSSTYC